MTLEDDLDRNDKRWVDITIITTILFFTIPFFINWYRMGLLMKRNHDKNGLDVRSATFPSALMKFFTLLFNCFCHWQGEITKSHPRVVSTVCLLCFSHSRPIYHLAIYQSYLTTRSTHLDGFQHWQLHSTTSGTHRDSRISNCSQSRGIQFPWIIGTLLWRSEAGMWQIHQLAQRCADGPCPGRTPQWKSLCLNGMR